MLHILLAAAALAALAFTPSWAQTSPAPAAKPIAPRPTADFAALPDFASPLIAPDGKHIAGKIPVNGKQALAILAIDVAAKPIIISADFDINWWRWVNKDWLVVGVGQKLSTEYGDIYVRRVFGTGVQGQTVPIAANGSAQIADRVIWIAHDGSPHILLGVQQSLFSEDSGFWTRVMDVDVSTGKMRTVQPPREGVSSWIADASGTIRIGVGHSVDGLRSQILYRPDSNSDFKTVIRTARPGDEYILPELFLPDPNKALAIANNARGEGAVFEYDLSTLQLGKQLYASPGYDVADLYETHDGKGLAAIGYDENGERIEWVDPELTKMHGEVATMVQNGTAEISSYSDDLQRALVHVSAPRAPGGYYLYDRPAHAMERVSFVNPSIKMMRLHPVRTVRYKARDGLEIAAVLTLPRADAKNLPLIVLPHGGPFARDDESWDWWTQFLADRGYAVIQPNYRGSSGYGRPFAQKGEGQWGLAMQDDLNDAVTYLAKEGVADPKRVCMAGASYGGYAALRAAQRDGKLYRCAISYAGVSDLNAMTRYDSQFLYGTAVRHWMRNQAPDFRAVSPLNHPEDFSIPVLILHGKADDVVPVDQSRDMAKRLKAANKPVTYIEQPLGDHHFTRSEDRLQFLTEMEKFLQQYNPADPPPAS